MDDAGAADGASALVPAGVIARPVTTLGRPGAASDDLPPGRQRHGWRLPAEARSVPSMRRGLRALLDDTELPADELYDLLLAACEATTNAIDHAQEPTEPFVDVTFEVGDGDGVVTIVVRDHGTWRHGPARPHRGRGMAMMGALTDMTVDAHANGTTVTLRSRPSTGQGSVEEEDAG